MSGMCKLSLGVSICALSVACACMVGCLCLLVCTVRSFWILRYGMCVSINFRSNKVLIDNFAVLTIS